MSGSILEKDFILRKVWINLPACLEVKSIVSHSNSFLFILKSKDGPQT